MNNHSESSSVIEKHTLAALVVDKAGILSRVSSLFRRRGFNIESIAVGASEEEGLSRITLVVIGTIVTVEQVRKQLEKLIGVVKVISLPAGCSVYCELALIKVKSMAATRGEIIQIVDIYRSKIVDVAADSLTIEITGNEEKINSLIDLLQDFGILEVARTGRLAISRGIR